MNFVPFSDFAENTVGCFQRYDLLNPNFDKELAELYCTETNCFTKKRLVEFLAGRLCLHRSLNLLNKSHDLHKPISIGESRQPVLPKGTVGSVTHCSGHAYALVADSLKYKSLGVDILSYQREEQISRIQEKFLSKEELIQYKCAQERSLIFSAKESLFKALFPLHLSFFGFDAAYCHSIGSTSLTLTINQKLAHYQKGHDFKVNFFKSKTFYLTASLIHNSSFT